MMKIPECNKTAADQRVDYELHSNIGESRRTTSHVRFTRRQLRGLGILVRGGQIERVTDKHFRVRSQHDRQLSYNVEWDSNIRKWKCECDDFQNSNSRSKIAKDGACKHVFATLYFLDLPRIVLANSYTKAGACPKDESHEVVHRGKRRNKGGMLQLYWCKQCKKRFREHLAGGKGGSTVALAVLGIDLHFRGVSLRNISEHIAQVYGIRKSPTAYLYWTRKFIELAKKASEKMTGYVGDQWHADEFFVKERGKIKYVWNVLDHDSRKLIVSMLLNGRGENEAVQAMRAAVEKAGKKPKSISTDGLSSYSNAVASLGAEIKHIKNVGIAKKANNNMIESFHSSMRALERKYRGLKDAERFADGFYSYYNYLRPHGSLESKPPGGAGRSWSSLLDDSS